MGKRNVIREDGVLVPSNPESWKPEIPRGSFYKELMNVINFHLQKSGDWDWLIDCLTGEVTKASEIEIYARKYAVIFRQYGFRKGDGIHLVVGNRNHSFLVLFGAFLLGGFGSCGDTALDETHISGQINDTEPKFLICTTETAEKVRKAVELSNFAQTIKIFCWGSHDGCIDLSTLLKFVNPKLCPEPLDTENVITDRLLVFWSSGTTGLPKGICHSHYTSWNLRSAWNGFNSIDVDMLTKNTNLVSTTCFFHIGGYFTAMRAISERNSNFHLFGKGFTLDILLKTIKTAKPDALVLGTHQYVQLSEYAGIFKTIDSNDLSSVTRILPAGSAVPAICEVKLKAKFPNLEYVFNVYGQTEAGLISIGTENGNLGHLHSGAQIKVVDPDSGRICKPGQIGEFNLKGAAMMTGYLNRPMETDQYFDSDGFGRSGDLGYFDDNGNIFYVDRMKELIKYQNNHVSPTEIEAILQTHPDVKESLVFGKKDPRVQELISAVVVLNEGSMATEEKLKEFVNTKVVVDYKKIRGSVIFRKEIPYNSVGKLLRREVRAWAENQTKSG